MLGQPPPLRNSEQQGRTLDWLATLRKSWRGLNNSPVWQLQYVHTHRRRFWWLLVDASRSTGSTDFLALVRNQLIQLTQQYRADRFHLMVLQSDESLCLGRKLSAIETEKRLWELQEAAGGSALFKLLRQSQVTLRRSRVGPKDRLIFASDGLFEVTGSSVTKEQSKLRQHWQQLLSTGASQWWHPAVARSGKLGGRVIERALLDDHAVRGGMNKKVRQLSTDNKMLTVHQQDVDAKKIIDLGTRVPVLRTPIASRCVDEAAYSLPELAQTLQGALAGQWKIPQQHVVCCPSTSEAYLAIAEVLPTDFCVVAPTLFYRLRTGNHLVPVTSNFFDLRQEEDFQFNESQLQNELSSVALVIVGNPHNPTGQYF